jgi:ribosome-associated protein
VQSTEKADLISKFADDMKAERIERLDVREKTSLADYFVICSGTSDTHLNAIVEKVAEKLKYEYEVRPNRKAGNGSGWVLYDYGDVIFHVMLEEKRQFYDLENFWKSMQADPDLAEYVK